MVVETLQIRGSKGGRLCDSTEKKVIVHEMKAMSLWSRVMGRREKTIEKLTGNISRRNQTWQYSVTEDGDREENLHYGQR